MMANTTLQPLNSLGYLSETVNHFDSSDYPRHIKNHLSPKELLVLRKGKQISHSSLRPSPTPKFNDYHEPTSWSFNIQLSEMLIFSASLKLKKLILQNCRDRRWLKKNPKKCSV